MFYQIIIQLNRWLAITTIVLKYNRFSSGYIRDECKFESLEALKERINQDIKEGSDKLDELSDLKTDELFR